MQLQDVPIFAWVDAFIVLKCIKQYPSLWKTYIANRVVKFQGIFPCDRWQHILPSHNIVSIPIK